MAEKEQPRYKVLWHCEGFEECWIVVDPNGQSIQTPFRTWTAAIIVCDELNRSLAVALEKKE